MRRELYHLYEHVLSNKTRLILDEMCRLYGKFASYFSSYKWAYCVTAALNCDVFLPTKFVSFVFNHLL